MGRFPPLAPLPRVGRVLQDYTSHLPPARDEVNRGGFSLLTQTLRRTWVSSLLGVSTTEGTTRMCRAYQVGAPHSSVGPRKRSRGEGVGIVPRRNSVRGLTLVLHRGGPPSIGAQRDPHGLVVGKGTRLGPHSRTGRDLLGGTSGSGGRHHLGGASAHAHPGSAWHKQSRTIATRSVSIVREAREEAGPKEGPSDSDGFGSGQFTQSATATQAAVGGRSP